MKSSIIASLALVASAAAKIGSAIVVNKCTYDVYLVNTPSANGGYSDISKVLSSEGTYSQQYTELSNGNGWSLKLAKNSGDTSILQYEYTFHNDGTIWYDLSAVDGNPWDSNWEITSDSSTCVPRQAAYRYATDDAYGMQSCPDDSTITVTLCSGESQNDSGAASASSAAGATTSATSTSKSASSTASSAASKSASSVVSTSASVTPVASTTMQTSVITSAPSTSGSGDVLVTVTQVATTTRWTHTWGGPGKRDAHAHHHAARHPHARD